jgi:hypothetical protein
MLDISTIILIMVHVVIAAGLNWLVNLTGLFKSLEIMICYFVVLSGYYVNLMNNLFLLYRADPEFVENMIREQLKIKKKQP